MEQARDSATREGMGVELTLRRTTIVVSVVEQSRDLATIVVAVVEQTLDLATIVVSVVEQTLDLATIAASVVEQALDLATIAASVVEQALDVVNLPQKEPVQDRQEILHLLMMTDQNLEQVLEEDNNG